MADLPKAGVPLGANPKSVPLLAGRRCSISVGRSDQLASDRVRRIRSLKSSWTRSIKATRRASPWS